MSSISVRRSGPCIGLAFFAVLLGACTVDASRPGHRREHPGNLGHGRGHRRQKRLLSLRDQSGEKVTVEVSPEVRNLPQVKVGDQVVARYYESLAAELVKRGDESGTTQAPVKDAVVGRSALGAKPGVVIGTENRQTVRITKFDKKNNVVHFYGSDGLARSIPDQVARGPGVRRQAQGGR